MRDRQVFETSRLPNGMTIYYYPMDVDIASMRIVVPVGHLDNSAPHPEGTAHFLEHVVLKRSKLLPEKHAFKRLVGLAGGDSNATTYLDRTTFEADVSAEMFSDVWRALVATVFEPIFCDEDIAIERGVILNERRRNERYWPGNNPVSRYLQTSFLRPPHKERLELQLGSDEALCNTSIDTLKRMHARYFDENVYIVVGGKLDIELVHNLIGQLTTKKMTRVIPVRPPEWIDRTYREVSVEGVTHLQYAMSGFTERQVLPQVQQAIGFILGAATNGVHGPLWSWLRNEKGWSYGLGTNIGTIQNHAIWTIEASLEHSGQAAVVHQEIADRFRKMLDGEAFLAIERKRRISLQHFWNQTLDSIIQGALDDLEKWGRIISETEWRENVEARFSRAFLREILETVMLANCGSLMLMSKPE